MSSDTPWICEATWSRLEVMSPVDGPHTGIVDVYFLQSHILETPKRKEVNPVMYLEQESNVELA